MTGNDPGPRGAGHIFNRLPLALQQLASLLRITPETLEE